MPENHNTQLINNSTITALEGAPVMNENTTNKENTMDTNTVIIPLLDSDVCLGKGCNAKIKGSPVVYWKGSNIHFNLRPELENLVASGGKPWTRVLMPLCGNHMRWLTSKKGTLVDYERVAAAMPFTGHCDCGACTTMGEAKACFEELATRIETEINNNKESKTMITTDITAPVILTMDAAKETYLANKGTHHIVRHLNGWIVVANGTKITTTVKSDNSKHAPTHLKIDSTKVFATRQLAVLEQIRVKGGKVVECDGGFKVVKLHTTV